jgi:ABC-2 type transport system ATP-binding protein
MKPILSVQSLEKRFRGSEALRGVSFDLAPDSVTALLGTNGAGKSTLLRCVMGLLAPERGCVRVLDRDPVRSADVVRGAIGYVPDQPDAYPWMTSRDLFRLLRGQFPGWSDEREARLVERLEIRLEARLGGLSRGEAAKVMLAAALAPAAPLVLLDEAFARLAPPVRDEVLRVFLEEAPAPGGAALVATHDLDVAARIADRVLVLDGGRLVADVDVEELQASLGGRGGLSDALRRLYPLTRNEELAL